MFLQTMSPQYLSGQNNILFFHLSVVISALINYFWYLFYPGASPQHSSGQDNNLDAIVEDDEESEDLKNVIDSAADEVHDVLHTNSGLTQIDVDLLSKSCETVSHHWTPNS